MSESSARGRVAQATVTDFAFRTTTFALGLGGLLFGLLAYFEVMSELGAGDETWNLSWFAILSLWPVLIGGLAFVAPVLLIRRLAAGYALAYLGTLAVWAVCAVPATDPHGDVWVLSITAIPAAAAMVARPRRSTWVYLVVMAVLTALVAIRTSQSPDAVPEGILTALYAFALSGFFVGCVFVILRETGRVDQRLREEASAEVTSHANAARAQERSRFQALVHDSVISTLLVAGRGAAPEPVLAAQATATLEQLAFRAEEVARSASELAEQLGGLARELAPDIHWSAQTDSELMVPPAAVEAIEGAMAEAIRNSLRHAGELNRQGQPVTIAGYLGTEGNQLRVIITDDGVGFLPEQVASTRIGVARSIRARMDAVGGLAHIESTPGAGTRVTLHWWQP